MCTSVWVTLNGPVTTTLGAAEFVEPVTATLPVAPFNVQSAATPSAGGLEGQAVTVSPPGGRNRSVTDDVFDDEVLSEPPQPASAAANEVTPTASVRNRGIREFTMATLQPGPVSAGPSIEAMDIAASGHQRPRWNHNIHYHRVVLKEVPGDARSALDVGTGNGLLAADLRDRLARVVAIDVDETVLQTARRERGDITWLRGDVMSYPFGETFDVVASVATLHHLPDPRSVLRRLAELTSPGGVLVVVGLARPTRLREFALAVVGVLQHKWLSWRKGYWEHTAPTVWPPRQSYSDVRRIAMAELPGVRWRLLPMFRYGLVWRKPSV